jgi:hypothetical protein
MSSAIVFPPEATLSVIPARPGPKIIGLPERVYPLPERVIEFIIVFSVRSFVFERFDAPAGKTKSSPVTGAVPPQLDATDQEPLVVPVHVRVAANADVLEKICNRKTATMTSAEVFKNFLITIYILFIPIIIHHKKRNSLTKSLGIQWYIQYI